MKLWTAATPNGWKVSILLEELIEAGVDLPEIEVRTIDLMAGEHFTPEYTRHNANQKIPTLIDGSLSLMESCAILQYLAERYPTDLLPQDERRWQVLPWVYWQAANVGPVFGNKLSYTRYMDEVDEAAKAHPLERFGREALRLVAVLDRQLERRDFVCGDQFTIADVALFPWIRGWKWSKVNITDRERVMAWLERVRARPGVERGLGYGVPEDEVDQWSEERKERYRRSGSSIASNERLRTEV